MFASRFLLRVCSLAMAFGGHVVSCVLDGVEGAPLMPCLSDVGGLTCVTRKLRRKIVRRNMWGKRSPKKNIVTNAICHIVNKKTCGRATRNIGNTNTKLSCNPRRRGHCPSGRLAARADKRHKQRV